MVLFFTASEYKISIGVGLLWLFYVYVCLCVYIYTSLYLYVYIHTSLYLYSYKFTFIYCFLQAFLQFKYRYYDRFLYCPFVPLHNSRILYLGIHNVLSSLSYFSAVWSSLIMPSIQLVTSLSMDSKRINFFFSNWNRDWCLFGISMFCIIHQAHFGDVIFYSSTRRIDKTYRYTFSQNYV